MAEILLYGIIGDPFDKLDAATVTGAIRASTGPLDVRINSAGGYVMEGLAIIEALRSYPAKVTIYIDGLAASMASAIAMVGAETIMAESALMMIHKPWDSSIGNADDLRRDAAKLDRIEAQLIGIYAKRTGLGDEAIAAMLAAETWFTPEEALAHGFVTSITAPLKIAAMADVSAYGFRHTPDQLKESTMTDTAQAVAAERTRISTIIALCGKHGLPDAVSASLIERGTTLDSARAAILDHLASEGDRLAIGHSMAGVSGQTMDSPDFHAKAVGDALYARMAGKVPEGAARELMGTTVVDMAREMLHRAGVRNAIRMRPADVLSEVSRYRGPQASGGVTITHTTSDFPDLLQGAGQRFLLDQYQAAASVLKQVARERSATDFRAITGVQLGGFGVLETVNEAGEFKNGTFAARSESYKLSTFGKMFNLSRQALVNDDLGAFADPLRIMARAAAETEAVALAALLNSNPVLSDGKALFHADHGNLAGAGAAPALTPLSAARLAMRTQKDLDGTTPLNVAPRFIVAGPALETTIEQVLAVIAATETDNVNAFAGKLLPLIDPRITGNGWYLFGDPASAPVFEYAYLNGESQPFLDSQDGWRVDGTEYKVRLDFGAGAIDWRGGYKNAGAA